jgi:hypothetical protein
LDALDLSDDALDLSDDAGGLEGVFDIDGVLEGALEGALDGPLDGVFEGGLEGALDGVFAIGGLEDKGLEDKGLEDKGLSPCNATTPDALVGVADFTFSIPIYKSIYTIITSRSF